MRSRDRILHSGEMEGEGQVEKCEGFVFAFANAAGYEDHGHVDQTRIHIEIQQLCYNYSTWMTIVE